MYREKTGIFGPMRPRLRIILSRTQQHAHRRGGERFCGESFAGVAYVRRNIPSMRLRMRIAFAVFIPEMASLHWISPIISFQDDARGYRCHL